MILLTVKHCPLRRVPSHADPWRSRIHPPLPAFDDLQPPLESKPPCLLSTPILLWVSAYAQRAVCPHLVSATLAACPRASAPMGLHRWRVTTGGIPSQVFSAL